MDTVLSLEKLDDYSLCGGLRELLFNERKALVDQLEVIGEFDRRKLFFHYASLRSFLVDEFDMEEHTAEKRIRVARALRRFPDLRELMRKGKLNMTLLEIALGCRSRERLCDAEFLELVNAIQDKKTRAARREVAALYPLTAELPHDRVEPINAEYSILHTVMRNDAIDRMDKVRAICAHAVPEGPRGELIDHMMIDYLKRHHPVEKAKRRRKKQSAAVDTATAARSATQVLAHELIFRDGFQCRYVDPVTGQRCASSYALEKDHVIAWADGGPTKLGNLRSLCRQHHARVTFLRFGNPGPGPI